MGYHSVIGQAHMARVKMAIDPVTILRVDMIPQPLIALVANDRAYQAYPYTAEVRRQFSGALTQAIVMLGENIVIEPSSADDIWRIGQSLSPYDTSVLLGRAQYLLHAKRYAEMPEVLERLERTAPNVVQTWIAIALYRELTGDREGAIKASHIGLSLPERPETPLLKAVLERLTQ